MQEYRSLVERLGRGLHPLRDGLTEEMLIRAKRECRIPSAVLAVIHLTYNKPSIILCKRSSNLKNHANQISFPGGVYKVSDGDLLVTALRECREEIGVSIGGKDIIGHMDVVNTLSSNFMILPFVALLYTIDSIKPNSSEIDEVIDADMHELFSSMSYDHEHYTCAGAYKFVYRGYTVWGATARILKRLMEMIYSSS